MTPLHRDLLTHQVKNQAKALIPLPLWQSDPALQRAVSEMGRSEIERVSTFAHRG